MSNHLVLGILEFLALGSCLWGLQISWGTSGTKLDLFYNGAWFLFGILTNILGIISAYYGLNHEEIEPLDDVRKDLLHRHYVMSWLTVIIGYPTLIASFYMNYYIGIWVHLIGLAGLIPFGVWLTYPNRLISTSTQLTIGALIPVHAWIAYSTGNWAGVYGAGAMGLSLISLSVPTRFECFGLTAREAFIATVGIGSILLAQALDSMTRDKNCLCYKAR